MKKHVIAILVSIFMISSVLTGSAVIVNKDKNLFDIEDGKVSLTIPVGAYEIISTFEGDEIFAEKFGRNLIPGKPNLPSKIFSIAIPPGSEIVDVSYDVSDSYVLPGKYDIIPVSLPRVVSEEDPDIYQRELKKYNENYKEVYKSNYPYPTSRTLVEEGNRVPQYAWQVDY